MEYNIKVFKDGDMWCALIGDNLDCGIGGFGITQIDAIRNMCNKKEIMEYNYEICYNRHDGTML